MVDFKQMVYVAGRRQVLPRRRSAARTRRRWTSAAPSSAIASPSAPRSPTGSRTPDVVKELRRSHPARGRQGFTVFFTGLSGSGKSTIANVLLSKLLELGGRPVTILDGDLVRKNLSSELGFSKEHRDINIRRIGYVASEITKHRGIAVCAPIAPYDDIRKEVRAMIAAPRRLHPGARQHQRRRVREARPQGPVRQGPRRHHQRVHRHQRPVRCAGRRRSRHRHAEALPPKKPPRKSTCGWKRKATSVPKSKTPRSKAQRRLLQKQSQLRPSAAGFGNSWYRKSTRIKPPTSYLSLFDRLPTWLFDHLPFASHDDLRHLTLLAQSRPRNASAGLQASQPCRPSSHTKLRSSPSSPSPPLAFFASASNLFIAFLGKVFFVTWTVYSSIVPSLAIDPFQRCTPCDRIAELDIPHHHAAFLLRLSLLITAFGTCRRTSLAPSPAASSR